MRARHVPDRVTPALGLVALLVLVVPPAVLELTDPGTDVDAYRGRMLARGLAATTDERRSLAMEIAETAARNAGDAVADLYDLPPPATSCRRPDAPSRVACSWRWRDNPPTSLDCDGWPPPAGRLPGCVIQE